MEALRLKPRPRRTHAFVLALALVSSSCAPSMHQLVEHRHYREAICAMWHGPPADDDLLRDALRRDLGAQVHARVVDIPIGSSDGPKVRVLKLRVTTNALPVDRMSMRVSGNPHGIFVADITSLAAVTQERLPEARNVVPGILEGLAIGLLAVATAGLVRIQPSPSRTEYPSESEMRRAAPRAFALAERLRSSCEQPAADGVAIRCSYAFIVPSDQREPVTLDLSFHLETLPEQNEACSFTEIARVTFGAPGSLAEDVAATYPQFRALREVATKQ
jgi:hypothetical protein